MTEELNRHTQPNPPLAIFANWSVIAEAWYFAFPSRSLKRGEIKSLEIGRQHLVVFRGDDGRARALDGFCPHMGTDLAIGKVVGSHVRCFFHHWKFSGDGACVDIPCGGENGARRPRARAYAVVERHGAIWVHPNRENPSAFPRFEEYVREDGSEVETIARVGRPYVRACHHHVTMINGIDPQHLSTVHGLQAAMNVEAKQNRDEIVFDLRGRLPSTTRRERFARFFFGQDYGYSVGYSGGSIGLLTTMKHTRFFGRGRAIPRFTMIFAYRPTRDRKTLVYPIFITRRRESLLGRAISQALLFGIKLAFMGLRDEDGKVYENIRFNPHAFLPIDRPLTRFIGYINRLKPSVWSDDYETATVTTRAEPAAERGLA